MYVEKNVVENNELSEAQKTNDSWGRHLKVDTVQF